MHPADRRRLLPRVTALAALAVLAVLAVLVAGGVQAQPAGVPLMKPAIPATPSPAAKVSPATAAAPRTINWEALVPAGWDPFKDFKTLDLASLNDADPRASALMARMRKAWDQAPVNPALAGQLVRIPGYVVPLEEGKAGMTEFLLVPYFGACVHTPPPPSNQIIHVLPQSPAAGLRSMDTVWVTGVLSTLQTDSYMGTASWRLSASGVVPYAEGSR